MSRWVHKQQNRGSIILRRERGSEIINGGIKTVVKVASYCMFRLYVCNNAIVTYTVQSPGTQFSILHCAMLLAHVLGVWKTCIIRVQMFQVERSLEIGHWRSFPRTRNAVVNINGLQNLLIQFLAQSFDIFVHKATVCTYYKLDTRT